MSTTPSVTRPMRITRTSPLLPRLLSVSLLTLAVARCGPPPESDDSTTNTSPPEESLATGESGLSTEAGVQYWPVPNPAIPVCFLNPPGEFIEQKQVVRAAVESTWMRVARVRFTGWGTCPTTFPENQSRFVSVRLTSFDEGSGGSAITSGLATLRKLDKVHWSTFPNSGADTGPSVHMSFSNNPAGYDVPRLEYLAVHEFGHVLGFAHEQDRTDNPNVGDDSGTPAHCRYRGNLGVNTYHSGFDRDSVMNYCNKYGNTRGYLSPADVAGVQRVYGRHGGAIVGFDGRCVDVPGGTNADWTPLHTWECGADNSANQHWLFDGNANEFLWVTPDGQLSGRVMDVWNGATYDGAPVQLYTRNGSVAQKWAMLDMDIQGLGGMCLHSDGFYNGARVRLWECNGSAQQKFTRHFDGTIRTRAPGTGVDKCLDADSNGGPGNGTIVQLWDCHGGSNQRWYPRSPGLLRAYSAFGSHCLTASTHDVLQFSGKNGDATLQLWQCPGGWLPLGAPQHQQYHFSGEIRGIAGRCLDVSGAQRANGTRLQMYTCHGGSNQKWDVYF